MYNETKFIQYLNKHKDIVKKSNYRLNSHLQPQIGWQNDPNGFIKFNDVYYYAYQYNPYKIPNRDGKLHWGLYTTKDFENFVDHGPIIYPDQVFDKDGVYSGSSIEINNSIYTYYTGNVKLKGEYDYINHGREHNTCLAISKDGVTYKTKKLLLTNDDYGNNLTKHVRDPFVFKKDNKFYMLLGARTKQNCGQILIFSSDNAIDFKYENVFYEDLNNKLGFMFECPNLLQFENTDMLIFSPQGVDKSVYNNGFYNEFNCVYLNGNVNWHELKFETNQEAKELDLGPDFYAPQVLTSEMKMLSWSACLEEYNYNNNITKQNMWDQCQNYPRNLTLNDQNQLIQKPIINLHKFKNVCESELNSINNMYFKFNVDKVFNLELFDKQFAISYQNNLINIIYKNEEIASKRNSRIFKNKNIKTIELYIDTSIIEIYFNEGEYTYCSRIFPNNYNLNLNTKQQFVVANIKPIKVTNKY